MICGAEDLIAVCREEIADTAHDLSADGRFSWEEVECLGACANAPMAQIGKDYYEDLTADSFRAILKDLADGKVPPPGSQTGRFASEPAAGLTSLHDAQGGTAQNASVALAAELDDTIKRIDGSEVPIVTPWLRGAAPPGTDEEGEAALREAAPREAAGVAEGRPEATHSAQGVRAAPGHPGSDTGDVSAAEAEADALAEAATDLPDEALQRPAGLDAPRGGQPDDLKMIKGVGPKLEALLNEMGFYHYDQLADWGAAEIAWVDRNLQGFKGRVTRDRWVAQARILAAGGTTEFSARADHD